MHACTHPLIYPSTHARIHPSMQVFSKTNAYLVKKGQAPVDWTVPE